MNRQETIHAIFCLLYDIRLNWADNVEKRVKKVIELCDTIDEDDFKVLKEECIKFNNFKPDDIDGRYFRDDFPYGYYNMPEKFNLFDSTHNNIRDKSEEFKQLVFDFITCPDLIFEDYFG